MTTEEMFQLLMNEVKTGQARLEAKIDAVAANVAEIKKDVSLLLEHDDVDTFNINGAYKEIKEVNEKLDKVIADQKLHKRATQGNINELQSQVNAIEDRLDKAS